MVRVHAKAGPWERPHAAYPITSFERTFLTLQNKNTFEQRYIGDLYTRASENASEKSVKFLERGPGGEPLPAAWALKIDGF